jgi:hypothetical protein
MTVTAPLQHPASAVPVADAIRTTSRDLALADLDSLLSGARSILSDHIHAIDPARLARIEHLLARADDLRQTIVDALSAGDDALAERQVAPFTGRVAAARALLDACPTTERCSSCCQVLTLLDLVIDEAIWEVTHAIDQENTARVHEGAA